MEKQRRQSNYPFSPNHSLILQRPRQNFSLEKPSLKTYVIARGQPQLQQTLQPNTFNTYALLRDQISTLCTQFTRLIHKDKDTVTQNNPKFKQQKDVNQIDKRLPTHSTMGFNHTINKVHQFRKNKQELHPTNEKKWYDSQKYSNKSNPSLLSPQKIQSKKSSHLQSQIEGLKEAKTKLELKNQILATTLSKIDQQNKKNTLHHNQQIQKLKQRIQQITSSLNTKTNLVDKLQEKIDNLIKQKLEKQNQNREKYYEIEKHYESQIVSIQNMQKDTINKIINDFNKHRSLLTKKDEQISQLNRHIQKIKLQYNILKEQHFQLKIRLQKFQSNHNHHQKKLNNCYPETKQNSDINSDKIQLQNIDLKKRVQSYRKTVEQLNTGNNNIRDKMVKLKQQLRIKIQENSQMKSQSNIKQLLITNLYKDIGVLDKQIQNLNKYKFLFKEHQNCVENLNITILQLEIKLLNIKYRQI